MRAGDSDYLRFVLRYLSSRDHGPDPASSSSGGTQFEILSTNRELQTPEFVLWTTQMAALFESHGLLEGSGVDTDELADLFCKIRANALGFPFCEEENLGWSLHANASMFNHSCVPNCFIEQGPQPLTAVFNSRLSGETGTICLKTKKDVELGEVIN